MAQGASSAGDPLDEMCSIDRDIACLKESIRALKSLRNEFSPISRFSAEILCNIFFLIEDDIFSSSLSPKFWTNFSQVSRHWRSIALSTPELWTKIPVCLPRRWAQERLIRSKMAKLTIRSGSSFKFDTSNPKAIETVRSCLYEMNRVEELKLTVYSRFLREIFRDLPKSAPQLHTLCIGATDTFSIHEDFLHDAERLQRVELFNCKISWDSRLLTGLTRLNLEYSLEANSKSSIIQFLHALRRMPALTDLRLIDSIPDVSEGSATYPVVDLPCLRILRISSGVGALTTVLRHITIPHSAILNLTCRENQSTHVDFSNFLSVLATNFFSSLVIQKLSLQIFDAAEAHGLEFYLWTTAIIQCQLQVLLIFSSWKPHHNHMKALTCAFNAMSLSFLTELHISTWDYIDSQTWAETFGELPLLRRVCVQGAPHLFLNALVYRTTAAEKSRKLYRTVSFPKLDHIILKGANLNSARLDMLLDCLMERCERKAEVRVLHLDDCYYISSNDVERLKEVVDVRVSDGKTDDSDYYDDFPSSLWY